MVGRQAQRTPTLSSMMDQYSVGVVDHEGRDERNVS